MLVEYWFDPACPFTWMTSRWIRSVADLRDLEIHWHPFSLMFRNEIGPESDVYEYVARTRNLLRVVEAARASGNELAIGDLYTEFGKKIHHEGTTEFDVAAILSGIGLDPALASALDDQSFDAAIQASMEIATELAGTAVGIPIIAVDDNEEKNAFFGPVITRMPDPAEALRLWDAYLALVEIPHFFEIKRTREETPDLSTIKF